MENGPISLGDENGVKKVLVQSVFGLWNVVNQLTSLRPTKHERYRVTIFGAARPAPDSEVYREVKRVAAALTEMGCDIITGGGPGLMQAANEGAADASPSDGRRSVGIRVDLPFEQDVNAFVTEAYEHQTFFTRLHHFVLASDAFVVAPGGIGTLLEAMMVWQLLQVKHLKDTPLILVGKMWPGLIDWARYEMLSFEPPLASPNDFALPTCVATADEAVAEIRLHHSVWQSNQSAS